MNILLSQSIDSEAIALLESGDRTIITAADPKPETILPILSHFSEFDLAGLAIPVGDG